MLIFFLKIMLIIRTAIIIVISMTKYLDFLRIPIEILKYLLDNSGENDNDNYNFMSVLLKFIEIMI